MPKVKDLAWSGSENEYSAKTIFNAEFVVYKAGEYKWKCEVHLAQEAFSIGSGMYLEEAFDKCQTYFKEQILGCICD